MRSSSSEGDKKEVRVIFGDIAVFDDVSDYSSDFISWQPLYDLYIMEGEMVITVEIAGIKPSDFSIHITRNHLVINGTRRSPEILSKKQCKFHNIEIPYGPFYRRIDFPLPVEPKQYQYCLNNGILILRFPVEKEKIIPIEDG